MAKRSRRNDLVKVTTALSGSRNEAHMRATVDRARSAAASPMDSRPRRLRTRSGARTHAIADSRW